jgi:hypothetical protein
LVGGHFRVDPLLFGSSSFDRIVNAHVVFVRIGASDVIIVRIFAAPDNAACLVFVAGAEMAKSRPDLKTEQIRTLADLGRLFRALITVYWNSLKLGFPWVQWPVLRLRLPQAALAEAIEQLGIK